MDMLDGYEDLSSDFQEKVGQAFEDGHVADDDWRGVKLPLKVVVQNLTETPRIRSKTVQE